MKSCNLKVGDRIRFDLRSPYSDEDIKYGCDSRVDGSTGTIQCIWDVNETCVVKLDTPLLYDDKRVVSEYWDFAYNLKKVLEEPKSPLNFEESWKQLKNYLDKKHKDYFLKHTISKNIENDSKLYELDEIIEHIKQIENIN